VGAGLLDRLEAVGCLGDEVDLRVAVEEVGQAEADQGDTRSWE
jgi:hypothetical protein